jgi:hypothetical protein
VVWDPRPLLVGVMKAEIMAQLGQMIVDCGKPPFRRSKAAARREQ